MPPREYRSRRERMRPKRRLPTKRIGMRSTLDDHHLMTITLSERSRDEQKLRTGAWPPG